MLAEAASGYTLTSGPRTSPGACGDEFVLLVDATSQQNLDALVDRLAQALNEPYLVDGRSLPVTFSIGLALDGPQYGGADEILRKADKAMYQAKLSHSGAVVRAS